MLLAHLKYIHEATILHALTKMDTHDYDKRNETHGRLAQAVWARFKAGTIRK